MNQVLPFKFRATSYVVSITVPWSQRLGDKNAFLVPPWFSQLDLVVRELALWASFSFQLSHELTSYSKKISNCGYQHNETTHVVKSLIYELDISYASTNIFRSNGYLHYN